MLVLKFRLIAEYSNQMRKISPLESDILSKQKQRLVDENLGCVSYHLVWVTSDKVLNDFV